MSDQASQAAMRAAGPDEDARWRVMPRFGAWVWGVLAVTQGLMGLRAFVNGPDYFGVIMHPLLAVLGLVVCVWSTSWTAAGAQGLRIRSGWRIREVAWEEITSVESSRMWGFRLTTGSGRHLVMQGLNQSRVGLLLYLWEHYRGPQEPQRAIGDRGRHGWWPAEPQRYIGARLGVGVLLVVVVMAVTLVVLLSDQPLGFTLSIGAILLALVLAVLVRVLLAGSVMKPDGVQVRTPATSRQVPWSAVHQVVVTGPEVAVVTSDGPVTLIGVPAGEAATIERLRHAHSATG